jgi:hypothetical protein
VTIYWRLKSVPELASLTWKQRRRVHEQCLRRHLFHAPATCRSIIACLSHIFTVVIVLIGGNSVLGAFGVTRNYCVWFILAGAGSLAGSFVFSRIAIPVLRPFYGEFAEKHESEMT